MKLTRTDKEQALTDTLRCGRQRVFLKFPTTCTDGSIRWLEYAWREGKRWTHLQGGLGVTYRYEAINE